MSNESDGLIPPHGGYRKLRSFQIAELVYDATVIFCDRFINRCSRTHDQMIQGARSGRQNIAEGSMASATSKKTEIKLTNVAKSSMEELLLDYEDYLRHRNLCQWTKDSPEAIKVRKISQSGYSCRTGPYSITESNNEVAANVIICLINQAIYLLKRQVERLEQDFLNHGGFTERLYKKRQEARHAETPPEIPQKTAPNCPKCSSPMLQRTARKGPNLGSQFWGCSSWPKCNATLPFT